MKFQLVLEVFRREFIQYELWQKELEKGLENTNGHLKRDLHFTN